MTLLLLFNQGSGGTAKTDADSFVLAEAQAIDGSAAAVDSAALSEAASLAVDIGSSDAATFAEQENVAIIEFRVSSDTAALTESQALTTQDAKTSSDSFTLAEVIALQRQSSQADAFAVAEAHSVAAALAALDSAALSEAQALTTLDDKASSDSFALTEAQVLESIEDMLGSDSFALTEAQMFSAAVTAADSAALAERGEGTGLDYDDTLLGRSGLIRYYRMSGVSGTSVPDALNGVAGSLINSPTVDVTGLITDLDTAISFAAASHQEMTVSVGTGTPVNLSTNGSISLWFKWSAGVAIMRDATSAGGWIIGFDNAGNFNVRIAGTTLSTGRTTASVRNGQTHHLVITKTGANGKVYLDGAEVATSAALANTAALTPWHIGRNGTSAGPQSSDLTADEVAFYDRALTQTEVEEEYALGLSGTGPLVRTATVAADSGALSEVGSAISFDAKDVTDSAAMAESLVLTAAIAPSDAASLAESIVASAAVAAADVATLVETAVGSEHAEKAASDSFSLAELVNLIQTNAVSVTDTAALTEAATLSSQLAGTDAGSLTEAVEVLQQVLKTGVDAGIFSEDAAVVIQAGAEYTHSMLPQVILGAYTSTAAAFAALAGGVEPVHAALVITAHEATIIVFDRKTNGIIIDPSDDAIGDEYQSDGTLR